MNAQKVVISGWVDLWDELNEQDLSLSFTIRDMTESIYQSEL